MIDLFSKRGKSRRTIDLIRKNLPGYWAWDPVMRHWQCGDGSHIEARAALAPRYDGDDDTFVTQYWRYFPDNRRPERVSFLVGR